MIGIFDSGVGGLTVVNAIKKINPDLSIIYFGDTARVPWGEKSPEIIQEYSKQICEFLLSKKVDKIVIACNTASSVAGDYLRKVFPNIEFIDVVTPTIMEIQNRKLMNVKKIAVIGTKVVVASNFYNKKITEIIGNI
ncbi:MAG: aspartate/glutamate racemase family protein, partial [Patescibacteria group bacterium]|nr:aspartate/glutamate racemase family protein [Patescibacteria group bacterium]